FIRLEEIADMAFTAFVQSLINTWVGVNVVKPIYPYPHFTPMNGKRAGVAVSLISVLAFCGLSSGCRHTEGQYTELMARLERGIEGKGLSTNTIATNAAAAQPEVHTVSLSRQIDRAWLQPPTNLFT